MKFQTIIIEFALLSRTGSLLRITMYTCIFLESMPGDSNQLSQDKNALHGSSFTVLDTEGK